MLYGAHPATIRFYRKGWTAFERRGLPTTLETIKTAIVGMRESGLGIGGANNFIRAWPVFCNWSADRGHIERFRIPPLEHPQRSPEAVRSCRNLIKD